MTNSKIPALLATSARFQPSGGVVPTLSVFHGMPRPIALEYQTAALLCTSSRPRLTGRLVGSSGPCMPHITAQLMKVSKVCGVNGVGLYSKRRWNSRYCLCVRKYPDACGALFRMRFGSEMSHGALFCLVLLESCT